MDHAGAENLDDGAGNHDEAGTAHPVRGLGDLAHRSGEGHCSKCKNSDTHKSPDQRHPATDGPEQFTRCGVGFRDRWKGFRFSNRRSITGACLIECCGAIRGSRFVVRSRFPRCRIGTDAGGLCHDFECEGTGFRMGIPGTGRPRDPVSPGVQWREWLHDDPVVCRLGDGGCDRFASGVDELDAVSGWLHALGEDNLDSVRR